jgi:hypothetical protein
MYSSKIAVPPGGGGLMKMILSLLNLVRKMEKVNSLVRKIYLTIYYLLINIKIQNTVICINWNSRSGRFKK